MDKYLVPPKPSQENSKPIRRRRWKRSNIELNGRFEPKYRHEMSGLLMQSYSEVACASREHNEVLIFDIGLTSSDPVQILRTRNILNVHGSDIHRGLSDIAFTSIDDSRLFASDTCGVINVWDTRNSYLPCLALTTNPCTILNSIEFDAENQLIFGAGSNGRIYIWDLRGGRESAAFQSHKEVCHPPLKSLKLSAMLEEIESLKAQSHIIPREIHSLDLDPSCPYQLAFHLDDGWSGVLDIYNFHVTHVHCPPPAWL
ncbi:hypothetical protein CJ030_MR1G005701 [Morella rubra]|uniref:Uncharacterized protein n=1 Tax=Morella rubra TaxID=262757 RepID=A0A6A1VLM6_9ROSI|nr:hypothetical protein CJ030_MR5G023762 [Morella rubra]KAB1227694.1 hypothetical protein CJ030_MR1G005701 [Morella rubra]